MDEGPQLLLLQYSAGHWDFPRGMQEAGESVEAAALREIQEETGIPGSALDRERGFRFEYSFEASYPDATVRKKVVLGLARLLEPRAIVLSDEHQGHAWLDLAAARRRLTYPGSRDALGRAAEFMSWKE